jgi:hypothetical protein
MSAVKVGQRVRKPFCQGCGSSDNPTIVDLTFIVKQGEARPFFVGQDPNEAGGTGSQNIEVSLCQSCCSTARDAISLSLMLRLLPEDKQEAIRQILKG